MPPMLHFATSTSPSVSRFAAEHPAFVLKAVFEQNLYRINPAPDTFVLGRAVMLATTDRISPSDQARSASRSDCVPASCSDTWCSGPGRTGRVSGDREAQRYLYVCFRSADGPQDASFHCLRFDLYDAPALFKAPVAPYGAGARAHRETREVTAVELEPKRRSTGRCAATVATSCVVFRGRSRVGGLSKTTREE